MRAARPSTTAVFPTPGSPISTGLFFVRRDRICITRSISVWRASTGWSFAPAASFVRWRPNWSSSFELFAFSPAAPPPCCRRPGPESMRMISLRIFSASGAKSSRLGADVVVAQRERLAQRKLEHLLRARGERDLAGRHLVALADDPGDLGANLFNRDVERLEDAGSKTLLLAEQAEQDVLGSDVVVLQRACFVL